MINNVVLVGYVGVIAPLKFLKTGVAVMDFQLATTSIHKRPGNADMSKTTSWHSVVLFGKAADTFYKLIKTGDLVYVSGAINYNYFIGKDGIKRQVTKIMGDTIKILTKDGRQTFSEPEPAPLPTDNDLDDKDFEIQ